MPSQRSLQQVIHAGTQKYGQLCQLEDVKFHMNPQSYHRTLQMVQSTQYTKAGFVRFEYTPQPAIYTLQGTTGTAGVYGAGGIAALDKFRPQVGSKTPGKALHFRCPMQFKGVLLVYLNHLDLSASADEHLFTYYDIELQEAPARPPVSAVKVASAVNLLQITAYG